MIAKLIVSNIELYHSFDSVYLFGSSLEDNTIAKDIDLLLVYSDYSADIVNDMKKISYVLEETTNLPVDLTVLSYEELETTEFLKRIENYLQLK